MRVLVAGGAGYIGSVVTAALLAGGHEVTVLDDLSTGHADAVPQGAALARRSSLHDSAPVLRRRPARGGAALRGPVPRRRLPAAARRTTGTPTSAARSRCSRRCARPDCRRIVFSSTAATYGEPESVPHPARTRPPGRPTPTAPPSSPSTTCSPRTRVAHGFAAVSLRYFNVAGAAPTALGERHATETHLIPIALQVAAGQRESLTVFGDDYPTPDGTCIRDYIHVERPRRRPPAGPAGAAAGEHRIYNLGNGTGFSVQEVVDAVREVTGHPVPVEVGSAAGRRPGPAGRLAATASARTWAGRRSTPTCAGIVARRLGRRAPAR